MKVSSTVMQPLKKNIEPTEFQPGDIIQLDLTITKGVFLVIENDPNYYHTVVLFTKNDLFSVGQRWSLIKDRSASKLELFKGSLTITVED